MKTEIAPAFAPDDRAMAVARAAELLRAGEVVALPTETVYGLAADALSAEAVVKIFETKERPRFDPLIVHLPDLEWMGRLAVVEDASRALIERLIASFWPGPLTIVLPRTDLVPSIVTAGLETIALRMSAHPLFAEVARILGRPIAAPSANRFGRISPTAAGHVAEELSGRLPLIVDGGPTEHGIESTVIAVRGSGIAVLRAGPITREELARFGKVRNRAEGKVEAPGQLKSHYRPETPLVIVSDLSGFPVPGEKRYGALLWSEKLFCKSFVEWRRLSATENLREAAANLFRHLRELDHAGLDCIVVEALPEEGLGVAIMDRLRRAAHS